MSILVVVLIVAGLAYAAYKSPVAKAMLSKVFGTKNTSAAADLAKKLDDKFKN